MQSYSFGRTRNLHTDSQGYAVRKLLPVNILYSLSQIHSNNTVAGQSTPSTGSLALHNVAEDNDHIHDAEPLGNFLGTKTL